MTDSANTPLALDPETLEFIQRRVSINLASVDATRRPAVTRVSGCRVDDGGRGLTLFVSSAGNGEVLDNIRANGALAVVFSRPSTHHTVQLKGRDARLYGVTGGDLPLIRAYRESLAEELGSLGYPVSFTHTLIPAAESIDTAIRFTPLEAYTQTPGPRAGGKLRV